MMLIRHAALGLLIAVLSQGCLVVDQGSSSSTSELISSSRDTKLCGRGGYGLECWTANSSGWTPIAGIPTLSDAGGWNQAVGYETIQLADINGDGKSDVCARGAAGLLCWLWDAGGWSPTFSIPALSDAAGWFRPEYYQTIRFADIDGDGKADVCVRGAGGLMCWTSSASGWIPHEGIPSLSNAMGWNRPEYYQTIHFADINGDGKADICARGAYGLECWISTGTGWVPWYGISTMSDAMGWNKPQYYQTIQMADINGDGRADICGRGAFGLECWVSTASGWVRSAGIPTLSDAGGWTSPVGFQTIQLADINGDGKADLCARGAAGLYCWLSTGNGWTPWYGITTMSDAMGWGVPEYYQTIRLADINGDGRADVCGRGAFGLECWVSTDNGWVSWNGISSMSDAMGWNLKRYYQTISLGAGSGSVKNFEIYPTTSIDQWSLGSYYPADGTPVSAIDWTGLTHAIHCCGAFNTDGSINLNAGWGNLANDQAEFIQAAHAHNVKALLLLWVNDLVPDAGTSGANLVNAVKRDGADREAQRIVDALTQYGYDGLDLDWEWSKSIDDSDTRNVIISLMAALRARLGNKILTTDAFPSQASQWVKSGAFNYVDRFNVMVYDNINCCDFTWHNAAFQGTSSFLWTLQQYQQAGAPLSKINLGIPFYGWRFWDGSTGPNQPRNKNADPNQRGQIRFADIMANYSRAPNVINYDSTAQVPWIRTSDGWITYDNEQSVAAKTRVVRDYQVGGVSLWELGQDYQPDQPQKHPLLDAVKGALPGINGSFLSNNVAAASAKKGVYLTYLVGFLLTGLGGLIWMSRRASGHPTPDEPQALTHAPHVDESTDSKERMAS